ncbi:hypothetical protein [Methylocucumis oryzae]|uniref:hypothetical protein n=1 Tax=Methylocucumis oryzae TaxID=1632867 RepID=UPI000695C9AF|nr:hypothetical protein [Methylocucumis oryzae]
MDNEEIAGALGLNVATLTGEWFRDYPDFHTAIKEGRIHADANIGSALYDRAMGYFAPEIKVFVIDGNVVEHEVMKHYPPDYKALQFWLTNRQAERWKNKVEVEKKQECPVIPQEELDAIYARNLEKQKEAMAKVMGRAARLGIANYVDSTAVEIDD